MESGIMKNYNKKDIKIAKFILENCETVHIPQGSFIDFVANHTNDGYEIEATITDDNNLDGYLLGNRSPLQRLNCYTDIVSIELELINGENVELDVVWDDDFQDNCFQTSNLFGYRKLCLSISRFNKEFSIKEVLKLKDGTIVIDEDGKEYKVEEDDECSYLFDTYVTERILNAKFKIKK
ncbi:hypothetical protein [Clostridium sp.]|uniref:hypothetical protein n=1 Tax=Clostridium sp. TaxID=1506 RepID=UPI003F2FFE31